MNRVDFLASVQKAINDRLPNVSEQTRKGLYDDIAFLSIPGITVPAPSTIPASNFKLSTTSLQKLNRVHPKLKQCVELAITFSSIDFGVNQGERTLAEQKKAVATGHSRTMNSRHLIQSDGFVWAVDLVAYVNGKISWQFDLYAEIALAMDKAATQLGISAHIRWGCAWDRVLSDFGGNKQDYLNEVTAYTKRHAGSDLLDGPHFEWVP
jgi:peptidoglycan L-alanyl-D-glutamate endopeptidase CwlK